MPIHSAASLLGTYDLTNVIGALSLCAAAWYAIAKIQGRKNTRERDWAGKMILIVSAPSSSIYALIHELLHLPRPPQILYLPPLPSPLPEHLLTILHTIRISASRNPLAQLHCEPLPRRPEAVAGFNHAWSTPIKGTAGEDGRRVDAVVLGPGWEMHMPEDFCADSKRGNSSAGTQEGEGKGWTVLQHHFHLLTALLPSLLRAPAERSIRVVSLVTPAWAAGIPTLKGNETRDTPLLSVALRGISTLLVMQHFQLVLDTLASAAYGKSAPEAPAVGAGEEAVVKKREEGLKSNIMALSVIMPWTKDYFQVMAADSALGYFFYIISLPLLYLGTPSSSRSIQSVLYALSAPIRYADGSVSGENLSGARGGSGGGSESLERGVSGGDVIRNCAVVPLSHLDPILADKGVARASYEAVEREVESRIKENKASASR